MKWDHKDTNHEKVIVGSLVAVCVEASSHSSRPFFPRKPIWKVDAQTERDNHRHNDSLSARHTSLFAGI